MKTPKFLTKENNPNNNNVNKQEKLFYFNSPEYIVRICHFPLLLQTLWIIDMIFEVYHPVTSHTYYIVLALGISVSAINILFMQPAIIYLLTFNNNVRVFFLKKDSSS